MGPQQQEGWKLDWGKIRAGPHRPSSFPSQRELCLRAGRGRVSVMWVLLYVCILSFGWGGVWGKLARWWESFLAGMSDMLVSTVVECPVALGHTVFRRQRHAAFLWLSLTHSVPTGLFEEYTCHLGLISALKCLMELDTRTFKQALTHPLILTLRHTPRHACRLH